MLVCVNVGECKALSLFCLSLIGWIHCAYLLCSVRSSGGGSAAPGQRRRPEC